jgi:hypothetical protein
MIHNAAKTILNTRQKQQELRGKKKKKESGNDKWSLKYIHFEGL